MGKSQLNTDSIRPLVCSHYRYGVEQCMAHIKYASVLSSDTTLPDRRPCHSGNLDRTCGHFEGIVAQEHPTCPKCSSYIRYTVRREGKFFARPCGCLMS